MSGYKAAKTVLCYPAIICMAMILMSDAGRSIGKRWDPSNKLTWSDYRDTLVGHSDCAALTNSGIRVSFVQNRSTEVKITAYSVMDRTKSWVDREKKKDNILAHEQCHFDITEYWCRRMKKDFATTRFTAQNLKEKIEAIRKADNNEWFEMQDQYDTETNHSEIMSEQKKWEQKVSVLLKSVEDYSDGSVTVILK